MQPTEERWVPVAGYEGLYDVSDQGRVRSLDRWVQTLGHKTAHLRRGRILKTTERKVDYYLTVTLYRPGSPPYPSAVQALVAAAFLGPRPVGLIICHANDDKHDNRLVNLRYATDSDNKYDAVRNGRHPKAAQTHCKRGHEFTPENTRVRTNPYHRECRTCRWLYKRGLLQAA